MARGLPFSGGNEDVPTMLAAMGIFNPTGGAGRSSQPTNNTRASEEFSESG